MVDLADRLDRGFQTLIIGQPAAHQRHHLAAQAQLPRSSARVADREDRQPVAFTARTLAAIADVIADGALQQRAAQQFAGYGQPCEGPLACCDELLTSHSYS